MDSPSGHQPPQTPITHREPHFTPPNPEDRLPDFVARIQWGLGDAALGLVVFLMAGFAVAAAVTAFAILTPSTEIGSINETALLPIALGGLAASALAFAGVPFIASRTKGQQSLKKDFGFSFSSSDIPLGFGLGAACLGVAVAISLTWTFLAGEAPERTQLFPDSPSLAVFFVLLLVVGVGVPVVEEIFFRGLVLRSLMKRKPGRVKSPILVSSVLFGVLHVQEISFFGLVVAPLLVTLIGVVFAVAAIKTGRLGAPIVGHAVYNSTVLTLATFIAV